MPATSQWVDSNNKWIGGGFTSAVNFVAVAVPFTTAHSYAASPGTIVSDNLVVPEPTTLMAPLAAFLLLRRRRHAA